MNASYRTASRRNGQLTNSAAAARMEDIDAVAAIFTDKINEAKKEYDEKKQAQETAEVEFKAAYQCSVESGDLAMRQWELRREEAIRAFERLAALQTVRHYVSMKLIKMTY